MFCTGCQWARIFSNETLNFRRPHAIKLEPLQIIYLDYINEEGDDWMDHDLPLLLCKMNWYSSAPFSSGTFEWASLRSSLWPPNTTLKLFMQVCPHPDSDDFSSGRFAPLPLGAPFGDAHLHCTTPFGQAVRCKCREGQGEAVCALSLCINSPPRRMFYLKIGYWIKQVM